MSVDDAPAVDPTPSTPDPSISALGDNIARKGKNAYYYAHAHKATGPKVSEGLSTCWGGFLATPDATCACVSAPYFAVGRKDRTAIAEQHNFPRRSLRVGAAPR